MQVGAFASHVDGFKKGGASDLIKAYHKKYADAHKKSTKKPVDTGTVVDSATSAATSSEDPSSDAADTEDPSNDPTVDPAVASFASTQAAAINMPLPCELERMRLEDRLEIVFVQALSALVTAFSARLVVSRLESWSCLSFNNRLRQPL
jgi:hypothetical protein